MTTGEYCKRPNGTRLFVIFVSNTQLIIDIIQKNFKIELILVSILAPKNVKGPPLGWVHTVH